MKDRYLFRAKRTVNGSWVEGHLIQSFTGAYYIVTEFDHILCTLERYEVDPSTICQCTSMTDKNAMIAFEHDIIKTHVGIAKIVWNSSPSPTDNHINVGFEVVFLDSTANDNYRHDLGYWIGKSEVIGSVFDNPELLHQNK